MTLNMLRLFTREANCNELQDACLLSLIQIRNDTREGELGGESGKHFKF